MNHDLHGEALVRWITEPYVQRPEQGPNKGHLPKQHRTITRDEHVQTVRQYVAALQEYRR